MFEFFSNLVGRVKLRYSPWILLLGAAVLCGLGGMFIRSAASVSLAYRHLVFTVVGIVAFLLMLLPDYRHLSVLAVPAYAAGVLSLFLLRFLGIEVHNARRWYDLGPINLQPSELMKIVLIICLATYFSYRPRTDRFRDLLIPLSATIVPVLLIIVQPDLGTALVLLPLFFITAFLANVPWKNLAILFGLGILLAVVAWYTPGMLAQYQRQRLTGFINPDAAPHSPAAYNARQATLAIAGGGWSGQGWGQGRLTQLKRIPERHTDFIFPVIAEEWGYVRTAAFVIFYFTMALLLWKMTSGTDEMFGRLLSGGVTALFTFQGALHMGISLRLAPITGLTLPLVSYGGSSLVATMIALGVAGNVALRQNAD